MSVNASEVVNFYDYEPEQSDFCKDVITGLAARRKSIPPKYFYDKRGSELFDEICKQPEYYPTRTEISILQNNAAQIANMIGPDCVLIELGSGASEKVRLLFAALAPVRYLGIDISKDFLLNATRRLARDYPELDVHALCADFTDRLVLPEQCHSEKLVAFFPDSSIGNFEPDQAVVFLKRVADMVGKGGKLLIGVDLKKDRAILDNAYNDAAGITADFNLNLLARMQNELDTDLKAAAFSHKAFYNEQLGRIEMHLVSKVKQTIQLYNQTITIDCNETIHTENSYKYHKEEFARLAQQAGFRVSHVWTDAEQLFSVQLCEVV